MSLSIRSARQSLSTAVLICWMMVRSMRLQDRKFSEFSAWSSLTSAIWATIEPVKSGSTGWTGQTKGTPGETRS